MSYKVQHKQNNSIIGVFNEIDEQAINQLIINNGSNLDQYEIIEFTPEEQPTATIESYSQFIEAPSDIEVLYDILKTKGVLSDEDIPEAIQARLSKEIGGVKLGDTQTDSGLCKAQMPDT